MIDDTTTVIRLILSVLLGGVIGFERQHRKKTAGLKTHVLVCLGSCLVTVLSINLYANVQGLTNADPARLAAQVVSGIGFLGAGAIIKEGPTIRGLTTAASLWVVASVGLAVGAGAIVGAVATTILVVLSLELLPKIDKLYRRGPAVSNLVVRSVERPGQIGRLGACLGAMGVTITQINIEDAESSTITIFLTVKLPEGLAIERVITEMTAVEGILSIEKEATE
ncbi:MAG: MgtC/SapB family protein [Negativicutes bacterium]|nr:MgtC/SapB family protein [Negativicutes bacterium]